MSAQSHATEAALRQAWLRQLAETRAAAGRAAPPPSAGRGAVVDAEQPYDTALMWLVVVAVGVCTGITLAALIAP